MDGNFSGNRTRKTPIKENKKKDQEPGLQLHISL